MPSENRGRIYVMKEGGSYRSPLKQKVCVPCNPVSYTHLTLPTKA